MKNYDKKLKIYFGIIYVVAFVLMAFFVKEQLYYTDFPKISSLIFFSALIALTETFTVYRKNISFSTTFAITLALFIVYGPLISLICLLIGYSFRVLKKPDGVKKHLLNTPFYGTLFNYCVLGLSLIGSYYIYTFLGGKAPICDIKNNFILLFIYSISFFIINIIIISILSSLITKKTIIYSLLLNLKYGILNTILLIPFGIFLAYLYINYNYVGVLLLFFPIILVRYTFILYIDSKTEYIETVDALTRAIEARDKYTEGHSKRVADIACLIGKEMKYNEFKIDKLRIAAMLHDIGKIGIDDDILNKPDKLTEEEFSIIKSHPEIGYSILKEVKSLSSALKIVLHHHERYDGKGYPMGKKGCELPIDVFIVQLADAVDAMASDRPYRKALKEDEIINELEKNSGTQFHPKVVEAYLSAIKKRK